jgi:carbon storage regulator
METMLVLTRKPQQEIIIGDDIRLTVLDIRGGRVKLAFTAPAKVEIRRKEVAAQNSEGRSPTTSPLASLLD